MLYFSYGSNMSIKRFLKRIPSAKRIAVAKLSYHELKFHKKSTKDGSGKCDIAETHNPDKIFFGVKAIKDPKPERHADEMAIYY
jgi:hypothetical protein